MKNSLKNGIALLTVLVFLALSPVYAQEKVAEAKQYVIDVGNAKCPIMGGEAQKEIFAVHEGKMYHFCCPSCIVEFKKDPAKIIAKIEPAPAGRQIKYEIAGNEKCPVMGNPVDKNISSVKDGKLYYFCCPSCIDNFLKSDKAPVEPAASVESDEKAKISGDTSR